MDTAGRPVLGICPGARIIAAAFGQRAFRDTRERGWVTIHGCRDTGNHCVPETQRVFHGYNEIYTLPEGEALFTHPRRRDQGFGILLWQCCRGAVLHGIDS